MTGPEPSRRQAAGRVPPNNLEAEESLIGSMILSRSAIRAAADLGIEPADFYKPAHSTIYRALQRLSDHGGHVDQVLLAEELGDDLEKVGGRATLSRLEAQTPASANAAFYARIVGDAATKRRLIKVAGDIAEVGFDTSIDAPESLEKALDWLRSVTLPMGGLPDPNVAEWLDQVDEIDFVVPHLLGRQERLLIVAGEGMGKTSLLRQFAVTCSGGLHPFRLYPITPINVLMLDLENPQSIARKKVRAMVENLLTLDHQLYDPERFIPVFRPEGLDLSSRAEERWFHERVDANARAMPGGKLDLLCVGPVYQMDPEAVEKGAGARRVLGAINRVRARHNCAVIIETHAPHESFGQKTGDRAIRPVGPRDWIRAPEFVMALQQVPGMPGHSDFWPVRPGRDERPWPKLLRRGARWPWEEEGWEDEEA